MFVCFCILVTGECPFDADVKCNGTGRCLRSPNICDGYSSCTYGDDEENCGMNITHIYICNLIYKNCPYLHIFCFKKCHFESLKQLVLLCYIVARPDMLSKYVEQPYH